MVSWRIHAALRKRCTSSTGLPRPACPQGLQVVEWWALGRWRGRSRQLGKGLHGGIKVACVACSEYRRRPRKAGAATAVSLCAGVLCALETLLLLGYSIKAVH